MTTPDLLLIGFGQSLTAVDMTECLKLIKDFRRISSFTPWRTEGMSYPWCTAMTVEIDDPEFQTADLNVLFVVSPKEQQNDTLKKAVVDLTKQLESWYGGTLYLVTFYPTMSLCAIRKKSTTDEDDPPATPPMEEPLETLIKRWAESSGQSTT